LIVALFSGATKMILPQKSFNPLSIAIFFAEGPAKKDFHFHRG
jgi:hypothetical protein